MVFENLQNKYTNYLTHNEMKIDVEQVFLIHYTKNTYIRLG